MFSACRPSIFVGFLQSRRAWHSPSTGRADGRSSPQGAGAPCNRWWTGCRIGSHGLSAHLDPAPGRRRRRDAPGLPPGRASAAPARLLCPVRGLAESRSVEPLRPLLRRSSPFASRARPHAAHGRSGLGPSFEDGSAGREVPASWIRRPPPVPSSSAGARAAGGGLHLGLRRHRGPMRRVPSVRRSGHHPGRGVRRPRQMLNGQGVGDRPGSARRRTPQGETGPQSHRLRRRVVRIRRGIPQPRPDRPIGLRRSVHSVQGAGRRQVHRPDRLRLARVGGGR